MDTYHLTFEGKNVGCYYTYDDGEVVYYRYDVEAEGLAEFLAARKLDKDVRQKGPIPYFAKLMMPEHRVSGLRASVWEDGPLRVTREPHEEDRFLVYHVGREPGEPGYSPKRHDAPHWEGDHTPEGMREWCTWYAFLRMDDGTYQAKLDESWWWGGGHNDGGTITRPIPEEWQGLPYEEFLERVLDLAAARHYGFDLEELLAKEGLRSFFGF